MSQHHLSYSFVRKLLRVSGSESSLMLVVVTSPGLHNKHNSGVIITIKSSASASSVNKLLVLHTWNTKYGINLQFSESDKNTKDRSMKSRRYSPKVDCFCCLESMTLLSWHKLSSRGTIFMTIPATLRTALSATSSWRTDRGWCLCHSSRLTRSHSMDLTLWTSESADQNNDSFSHSGDHPEPHVNWDGRL